MNNLFNDGDLHTRLTLSVPNRKHVPVDKLIVSFFLLKLLSEYLKNIQNVVNSYLVQLSCSIPNLSLFSNSSFDDFSNLLKNFIKKIIIGSRGKRADKKRLGNKFNR